MRSRSRRGLDRRSPPCRLHVLPEGARVEAARPSPRIFVEANASANLDRADMHITEIDVPAFLAGVSRSAAGEFGHAPLKRDSAG
jgi:hypothetical protein